MSPRRATHRRVLALATLALACIEDLDPQSIVRHLRVLDVVAEPPELRPGETLRLRAILGGHRETPRYRWVACLTPEPLGLPIATANFGTNTQELGCFGDGAVGVRALGNDATASFTVPPVLFAGCGVLGGVDAGTPPPGGSASCELLAARLGGALRPETLALIAREVGVVLSFGLEVEADGRRLRALKRVVVSLSDRPNRNPPAPRFRVGRVPVGPAAEGVDLCRVEGATPLRVRVGERLDLVPDPVEEPWLERYRVLTAAGDLADRRELAFYSWAATGGSFARGLTRTPTRDNVWSAPATPGPHSLWMLVRDGRGGSSGCRLDLVVE